MNDDVTEVIDQDTDIDAEDVVEEAAPELRTIEDDWSERATVCTQTPSAQEFEALRLEEAFDGYGGAYGHVTGQPGDYLVRAKGDTTDFWVVSGEVFDEHYASGRSDDKAEIERLTGEVEVLRAALTAEQDAHVATTAKLDELLASLPQIDVVPEAEVQEPPGDVTPGDSGMPF